MNKNLPVLPLWQARSFYAQILLAASVLLNMLGIDLFGVLAEIGAGTTPDEVLATGDRVVSAWQQVAPLVFGLWAWIERRAPNFRLVFWRPADTDTSLRFLGCIMLVGLLTFGVTGTAMAQAVPCGGLADVMADRATRFGEATLWSGVFGGGLLLSVVANPDGSSWSVLSIQPDGIACLLGSGEGWVEGLAPAKPAAPGVPG